MYSGWSFSITADILESVRDEIVVAMITETGGKNDWIWGKLLRPRPSREVVSMASQDKADIIPSLVTGTIIW